MATRQTTDFPAGGILTDTMLDNEFNEIYTNITDTNIAAGAAIAISKTTLGTYTAWTAWTLSQSGWSGSPTTVSRYMQLGKGIWCYVYINGTSNNATHTFALPVGVNTTPINGNSSYPIVRVYNAGNWQSQPGMIDLNNSTATIYKDPQGATLDASGTVAIMVEFFYEAA